MDSKFEFQPAVFLTILLVRELFKKAKSGEDLTATEQATLDEVKANKGDKKGKKGKMGKHLTDEEKTAVEAMSDDEKKAFFTAKKDEKTAGKQASKAVITALIAGETLSADQEVLRTEMIAKMAEKAD